MKPEFMRLRRALAGTVAALLLAAGLVVLSPALSASAHVPSVNADCTNGLSVTLTSYPSNTEVTVVINGTTVTDISFGGDWSESYTWDKNVDNTYRVVVKSPDDPYNTKGWSIDKSQTVKGCPDDKPAIGITASTCSTASSPSGTVTFSLSGVSKSYTVSLLAGSTVKATAQSSGGTGSFAGVSPGTYTVTASSDSVAVYDTDGGLLTQSANATILACTDEFTVTVELEPCATLQMATDREINMTVNGLTATTAYTVRLVTTATPAVEIDSMTVPSGTAGTFTHTFGGVPSPGDYKVEVLGSSPLVSNTVTAADCDLDTLAPPSIELISDQCDASGTGIAALSASMIDLDATKTYFVRIVDGSGATVPGGEDKSVTGSTTATVTFPAVTAAGTYTAQLLINPGKQLAATSPASVVLNVCLPTLAMTGPGVLVPLGGVAALLLTLGGAVVMGRLRRRMAL
ncbi:hypothetical protein ACX3O0_09960 [Homoserinimonas sp. A447]